MPTAQASFFINGSCFGGNCFGDDRFRGNRFGDDRFGDDRFGDALCACTLPHTPGFKKNKQHSSELI